MRNLRQLDSHRLEVRKYYGSNGDETCGAFSLPSPVDGQPLHIVASSGDGWDHVSVSRTSRCPHWLEMDFVKRRFFEDHEIAMQLHVAPKDHINRHKYTLHLWRPLGRDIPLPPAEFV